MFSTSSSSSSSLCSDSSLDEDSADGPTMVGNRPRWTCSSSSSSEDSVGNPTVGYGSRCTITPVEVYQIEFSEVSNALFKGPKKTGCVSFISPHKPTILDICHISCDNKLNDNDYIISITPPTRFGGGNTFFVVYTTLVQKIDFDSCAVETTLGGIPLCNITVFPALVDGKCCAASVLECLFSSWPLHHYSFGSLTLKKQDATWLLNLTALR